MVTSVRWPTTSRPSRTHDRRASSSRRPAVSVTAVATAGARPGGSRTTTVQPARRPRAASRPSRSPRPGRRPPADRPDAGRAGVALPGGAPIAAGRPDAGRVGRSRTRRSTVRPARSAPAIARASSRSAGVTTTSHSGLTPRATASTGSNAAARSSQATIAPAAWASAASRSAMVVRPLDGPPATAANVPRGSPPRPRIASSAANPVGWICPSSTI